MSPDETQSHSFGGWNMIVIDGKQLITLGDVQMQMFHILAKVTSLITACYGTHSFDNMTLRCSRLRCPLGRLSGLQCYNMGHKY